MMARPNRGESAAAEGNRSMLLDKSVPADARAAASRGAPVPPGLPRASLPSGVALGEHLSGLLRRYLDAAGLGDYQIFFCDGLIVDDVDYFLNDLNETAVWEPLPALVSDGLQPCQLLHEDVDPATARLAEPGVLRLRSMDLVLARWYAFEPTRRYWNTLWLFAAPAGDRFLKLQKEMIRLRRRRGAAVWQVIGADGEERNRREDVGGLDALILSDRVRRRLETEVTAFFTDAAASLYKRLGVPYRRGVLLHGPPGNGKTSIVRSVAAAIPHVPALVVRAERGFCDGAFHAVIHRWFEQAPSVLVIEDLDWLLPEISVSTFLNAIDGLEAPRASGLLLLATTNHPENLDPAINNRPGRFDVVIEVAGPDADLRRQFLARGLPDLPAAEIDALAARTDGLSFAHLKEIQNLSGLLAIHAGRGQRDADDIAKATDLVVAGHDEARRGFPANPESPFGLARAPAPRR